MSNIPVLNPMLFIILFFTLTLLFLVAVFIGKKNGNGGGTDKDCEFDRACPACHRLLKKEWANCPYCGHKEDQK